MDEKIEIVFSFDTTGSVYSIIDQLRKNLENTVGTLFKELPNLKVGLAANGDYGDLVRSGYDTKHMDLTSDLYNLTQFIRGANKTIGFGNDGEAYELVLHRAQTAYNWSINARKILVLIGDEKPHTPNWHENKQRLDWQIEAKKLADMGVQIYTIQCLSRREANFFYSGLAQIGNGYHLELDQFVDILSLVQAIIWRQVSDEKIKAYEEVIVNRGEMTRALDVSFATLTGRPRDAKGRFVKINESLSDDLKPVPNGRFQMLDIDQEQDIRSFVEDHSLAFKPGKGFYEFLKSETIQKNKEIVLRDRKTGDMYSGDKARTLLGIPIGIEKTISPRTSNATDYQVFIQSTSFNRKLKPGTKFLYEVDLSQ